MSFVLGTSSTTTALSPYHYHRLVQWWLRSSFFQYVPQRSQVVRRALAEYYRRVLKRVQVEEERRSAPSIVWGELVQALLWNCLASAFLGRYEEAVGALRQALAAEPPVPTVLLAPLRWLELPHPDFYRASIAPLLIDEVYEFSNPYQ